MDQKIHSTPFRVWPGNAEQRAREEVRRKNEESPYLVRVVIDPDGEAVVYRQGRAGLKHQTLKPEEIIMMGDDERAYFVAKWSPIEVRWNLLKKSNQRFT